MKIILTLYLFALIISEGVLFAKEIELSPRSGKGLTLEARNYFGLFPEINDFRSAALHSEGGKRYFLVETGSREIEYPISDSALAGLRELMENFEEFLAGKWKYPRNSKELSGIIKIRTYANDSKKAIRIKLMNNMWVSGYIIHCDSNSIFIIPNNSYDKSAKLYFPISYRDIKSINGMPYPIIEGEKLLFRENLDHIGKLALYQNKDNVNIAPPEIINYKYKNSNLSKEDSSITHRNIDSIYRKRTIIWFDCSYQYFIQRNLLLQSEIGRQSLRNESIGYKALNGYYSHGLSVTHEISPKTRIKFGAFKENINIGIWEEISGGQLQSEGFILGAHYKLWQSKEFQFMNNQYYLDVFARTEMRRFHLSSKRFRHLSSNLYDYYNNATTRKYDYSYAGGFCLNYKYYKVIMSLSGFMNYHNNYGGFNIINLGRTRNINYLVSYGASLGVGMAID